MDREQFRRTPYPGRRNVSRSVGDNVDPRSCRIWKQSRCEFRTITRLNSFALLQEMNAQANIALSPAATAVNRRELRPSLVRLKAWVEQRDFAGWEPYDLLNSPFLSRGIRTNFPLNWLAIQVGKRSGWTGLRRLLRVPSSKNPKALALFLSGFCDLARMGESAIDQAEYLVSELLRLRSPGEIEYCWGYD